MTPSEFIKEIENYWSKNREEGEVSKAIVGVVKNANSPALKATLAELQKSVAPNYLIGVKHVMEAVSASGSSLTRHPAKRFDVKCCCCSRVYSYSQGASDTCPFCGYIYLDQQEHDAYKRDGKVPKSMMEYYLRQMDLCGSRYDKGVKGGS